MNNLKWNIVVVLIIAFMILGAIFGTIEQNKAESALKNSDSVVAVITKKEFGKDQSIISVKYTYKNIAMHGQFITERDTFSVGDEILLKVARKYPEKYISFMRMTKPVSNRSHHVLF